MATVPAPLHATIPAIYALHEQRADRVERPYLGASELGDVCPRRLWLRFRWAAVEQFEGRMLRLFDSGNREEDRLLEELVAIGLQVEGRQHEVMYACGHGKGHMDAAVLGLQEAPKTWHVIDVKTAKTSKFAEMQKKGVGAVYPRYAAQLQLYMGLTGMTRAAFFVVCKDTDEIHFERVDYDPVEYARLIAKAESIVFAPQPPARISEDASWYECKFCPFHSLCHVDQAPATNCRTCVHSTPQRDGDGRWSCDKNGVDLTVEQQRKGCPCHLHFPALLERFAEFVTADDDSATYRNKLNAATFVNGPRQPQQYASGEISAANDKRVLGDADFHELRRAFNGKVVA